MKTLVCSVVFASMFFAGCSKPTAEEYFARAQKSYGLVQRQADTLKNQQQLPDLFTPVMAEYEELISQHPASKEAETAMFLVATIQNNDLHQYQPAIDAYRRYVQHYPEGKQAPLAMFMMGYLYNNELRLLDSAASAYKRFLEKYPNSEMAASAKFELETLGKSPEELVPKEVVAEKPSPKAPKKAPKGKK